MLGDLVDAHGVPARFDGHLGLALLDSVEAAVEVGLVLLARPEARGVSVAIGHGLVAQRGDAVLGAEVVRARRAATLGVGELELTEAARAALRVPEGIGLFRAPEAREALLAQPMYVIRDYRGEG